MNSLDSIAAAFCHSFYKKEWIGNNAAIRRLTVAVVEELYNGKK